MFPGGLAFCLNDLLPLPQSSLPLPQGPLPLPHEGGVESLRPSNRPLFDPPEARSKGRYALRPDPSSPPRRAGAVKGCNRLRRAPRRASLDRFEHRGTHRYPDEP
jgi:hypothetical protein